MVVSALVNETARQLKDNARFEAELMVMRALGITRTELVLNSKRNVSPSEKWAVCDMVKRRLKGEPLQYIFGECEFMSLDFYVGEGVLIPRSDTEILVETIMETAADNAKILDICTGSGCIGISLAHYIKNAQVTLIDISDSALSFAERNILRHNLSCRVKMQRMDILKVCPNEKYDIVVSNPPYIETDVISTLMEEVREHEPHIALDGGKDGLLFYERIINIAPYILAENGCLAFEIGYNQGQAVKTMMEKNFINVRIIKDFGGNDRVVTGILKRREKRNG